jgi:hypothetical protein
VTLLDAAHAAMEASDDEAERRTFWGEVAGSELHLWLEAEAEGDAARPRLFEIDGAFYALAFDGEDRLAGFVGGTAPTPSLPGRRLAAMLAEAGLGLGLNFGAPSETLLPPDGVAWLADTAATTAEVAEGLATRLDPPTLPPALVAAIDRRLAAAEGLARRAWLASATWADGRAGHLLGVEEVAAGAAGPIAQSVAEALAFAGAEVPLDVAPVTPDSPLAARLQRVGLRFDLPGPPAPEPPDPSRPPRLR